MVVSVKWLVIFSTARGNYLCRVCAATLCDYIVESLVGIACRGDIVSASVKDICARTLGVVGGEVLEVYGDGYVLVAVRFNVTRLCKADERYGRLFNAVTLIVVGEGRLNVYLHHLFAAALASVGDGERNGHFARLGVEVGECEI